MSGTIIVVRTGAPLLLEDPGRRDAAALGVPTAGAFDAQAAALAQRLVGNDADEAALEITLGRARLEIDATATAVITGPSVGIAVAGAPVAVHEVFSWPAGTELDIGLPREGVRNYLAVRGGFAATRFLGSASHDVLSGLGPPPLVAGDTIALAHRRSGQPLIDQAPVGPAERGPLRARPGPRADWFVAEAMQRLESATFIVAANSNRIGIRLTGPVLARARSGELPSEPLQRGAIQVPPAGQPIVMGPDHPTTGGYPVIATVDAADWDRCGQLRPGDEVRFAVRRA